MPSIITAKALRERRAPLAATIRQLAELVNTENRDFTAEEKPQWDQVNADYNALTRQIEIAERGELVAGDQDALVGDALAGREDKNGKPRGDGAQEVTEEHRAIAIQAWSRFQLGMTLTEAQENACKLLRFNPGCSQLVIPLMGSSPYARFQRQYRAYHPSVAMDRMAEYKAALTIGSGAAGGYLIPPENFVRQLEINMLAYGGVRQVAEIMTTTGGERMGWPTADDTSNTGAQLGENTSIGASVDPTFAKVYWDAYKFSSKPVLVPYELLEDSAFNLVTILGDMLGERLGRITNTRYTTGTGAATPKGVVTASTLGVTAASATAIAADEIIRLEHSIDPAYRNGASYMMHDTILLELRLLKDGEGRYLWQTGFNTGTPDTLNLRPVTINQDMQSSIATATKTILFGQFSKYKIRRVGQMRLYRLEERYRDTDQDGFIAFIREDGNLLTAGTSPLKHLLQA